MHSGSDAAEGSFYIPVRKNSAAAIAETPIKERELKTGSWLNSCVRNLDFKITQKFNLIQIN
ncbi:MAG: hypothetical protein AMXMBFR48_28560 [Ignavibacteriales bacterium]